MKHVECGLLWHQCGQNTNTQLVLILYLSTRLCVSVFSPRPTWHCATTASMLLLFTQVEVIPALCLLPEDKDNPAQAYTGTCQQYSHWGSKRSKSGYSGAPHAHLIPRAHSEGIDAVMHSEQPRTLQGPFFAQNCQIE